MTIQNSAIDVAQFRHVIPIQIRWGDMDAMGHVNNATFLTYFEQSRLTYFNELGLWDGMGERSNPGLIMAKAVIEYKMPLIATDTIRVGVRTTRLGTRSFETFQAVIRTKDGIDEIAATGVVTVVVYDYANGRSTAIPQAWREKLIAYEPVEIAQGSG